MATARAVHERWELLRHVAVEGRFLGVSRHLKLGSSEIIFFYVHIGYTHIYLPAVTSVALCFSAFQQLTRSMLRVRHGGCVACQEYRGGSCCVCVCGVR